MQYSFDVDLAAKYGVNEAIFLHNLYYWIIHNEANGRHYFEDKNDPGTWRNWTYNSASALTKLFPFWSSSKIDKLTRKMRDNGLIHIGNYNKSKFDRTKWYALSDEILSAYQRNAIGQIAESDSAESPNLNPPNGGISIGQMAEPIPDSKPDINTDSKPDSKPRRPKAGQKPKVDTMSAVDESDLSDPLKAKVRDWFTYKDERGEKYTPTGLKSLMTQIANKQREFGDDAVIDVIDLSMSNNWAGIIWDRIAKQNQRTGGGAAKKTFSQIIAERSGQ